MITRPEPVSMIPGNVVDPTMAARLVLVLVVLGVSLIRTALVLHWLLLDTVWIVPGIMLAVGYRFRGRRCWDTLLLMALCDMVGTRLAGTPVAVALLFALVHAAEAVAGIVALRRIAPDGLDLGKTRSTFALFIVAVLVAPPVGIAISVAVHQVAPLMADQVSYLALFSGPRGIIGIAGRWVLPGILGIVLAAPLSLSLLGDASLDWRVVFSRRRMIDHGVVALVTVAVFFSRGTAYTAFLPAALVWIGVRQGVRDVGVATLVSLLIASVAVALGNGPADVLDSAPHVRQMFLEMTYLCCYGWVLPVAVALESRDRLEQELAGSLESSRQILINLHEVVFRLDADGRWTYLNPAWESVTGFSVEESLGKMALDMVQPADLAPTIDLIAQLTDGQMREFRMQRRFQRRDGAMRDVDILVRAVHDATGRFSGALGSMRDVTEQLHYVQALEKSEQRFRMVCDAAPVGIIRFNRTGKVTYLNARCELQLMNPSENLVGKAWQDAFGPAAAAVWDTLTGVLVTPGAVYERELEIDDKAGLRRWLTLSVTGEFDTGTQAVGYIAAVNDITESRKSAAELGRRTSELRLVTENINDVIVRSSLDGTLLYVSPSVREVLGYTPQMLVGQGMDKLVHADDRARVFAAFGRLAKGKIDKLTIAWRETRCCSDSDMIWLEANARLLRDWAGKPFEIVTSVRDVTLSKTLEFDLIEARSRAEAAARAKSQFLANLSHEIRTPMNGVIGLADLLLGHTLDPGTRRYVETIAQSGQTMMTLLNDILDIARIDSGRLQLTPEPFDLRDCLAGSLRLMTASALGKGLDLQQAIAPDVPQRIVGDSLRLRQILANLIGNAIKFTAVGFVRLGASREGDRLVITVEDSGIGIPEDQQARLFDEFVQADATVAGVYGGSGLGLAISRRLTEAMGGDLSLRSTPGVGTTLTLVLPITEPTTAPVPVKAALPIPPAATGTGLHLLVAEDNHTNQIIMTAMLQRLGHSVEVAGCGEDVLEMVESAQAGGRPFDGVLMDIQMPGMDGLVATRHLRERGHDAERLPVIAVTANGYNEDVEECLRAGMQGHLVKPVRVATLAGEIDRMVGKRAAA